MLTPVFKGFVSAEGQLLLADRKSFLEYLKSQAGKHVEVVVQRIKKRRSKPQNDYLRGVIVRILANEWGWEEDDMHEFLLAKLAPRRKAEKGPDQIIRSSEMTTVRFNEYCEKIRRWAAIEYQMNLPEPNEVIID
jgi:hypothetical protein